MTMSLGRLLTSGKSLVGLQNATSRYEMRNKNLLPKFGSEKNPFTTAKPESLKSSSDGKFQVESHAPMNAEEMAAENLKRGRQLPEVASLKENSSGNPAVFMKAFTGIGGWVKKFNPISRLKNRKPPEARRAIQPFGKPAVQGELSLENIKVMRNDLSDADLEIVPAKPAAKESPMNEPRIESAKAERRDELIKT
ncbi:MAG TPA: hypothetical protein VFM25_12725 [Verrucomicrobiae bacterium]|nr:hypothetical protein [Verrucomicrobiae bacterium]